MSKATLLELADLAERTQKADRELDVLIHAEIEDRDVRWQGNLLLGKSRRAPHDECMLGTIDPGKVARNFTPTWSSPECPRYTSSLDAAMTLVPEGMEWLVRSASQFAMGNKDRCYANVGNQSGESYANTGPLALTAACLRASAQQESKDA